MAIITPLGGTGGISDATINTMLQSGDPGLVKQANEYIAQREKEIKEREADKGILGTVADLFGFSKLAAAEPDMPSSQKFSNQFSVTQSPEFEMRPEINVPGNINMASSVFADYPFLNANTQGVLRSLTPEQQLNLFLQSEGGDVDIEDINRFAPQGIFSRAVDFAQRPDVRTGLGLVLGGIPGAALSFFAPKIGRGITSLVDRFRNRGRDVEIGLPQVIQTGSEFVDEFAPPNDPGTVGGSSFDTATGGTFGSASPDASTFSDYS